MLPLIAVVTHASLPWTQAVKPLAMPCRQQCIDGLKLSESLPVFLVRSMAFLSLLHELAMTASQGRRHHVIAQIKPAFRSHALQSAMSADASTGCTEARSVGDAAPEVNFSHRLSFCCMQSDEEDSGHVAPKSHLKQDWLQCSVLYGTSNAASEIDDFSAS